MIFNNIFTKLFIIAALCISSLYFTACNNAEIDDPKFPSGDEEPQPGDDDGALKPGDDFYTYANAEWLKSLEDANPEETYGWKKDVSDASDAYLEAVKDEMPQYAILGEDLDMCEENSEASLEIVIKIATDMANNIKTREDAYIAYGQAIRMGITAAAGLHLGICRDDNTLGYFFLPPTVAEAESNATYSNRPSDVRFFNKRDQYTPMTRGGKSTIDYILEGIGLDPQYYIYDEISEQTVAALEQLPLQELVTTILKAVQAELMMYCGDEYAVQNSDGKFQSVGDFVSKTIENDLGYFTSYYYVNKYVTQDMQDTFRGYSRNIANSFRKRLENNTWLSSATKQAAIDKLNNMDMEFGAPKIWPLTQMPELEGESLLADVLKIKECRYNVIESLMGVSYEGYLPIYAMLTVEDGDESIYAYECNAFYSTSYNAFYVLAPFMMNPSYNKDMEEVEIYATLGTIIGHEITHGFDKLGATYDKYGEKNDWWTAIDKAKFEELNNRLIANINTYELIPGLQADGERTVTEDVADLGGFNIAYDYWVSHLKEQGVTGEELKEEKKKFFLHYAKVFREKLPNEYIINEVATDVHSIGHIRINAVVQQIDDWYELFNVKEGDALYLAPEDRIKIW